MKRSEKMLVGGGMIVSGLALVLILGLEQCGTFSNNIETANSLKNEITSLEARKAAIQANIRTLELGVKLPADIRIREYTPETRDEVIKLIIDQVVQSATDNGNLFISLLPTQVPPLIPPAEETSTANTNATAGQPGQPAANGATAPAPTDPAVVGGPVINLGEQQEEDPGPSLDTFGYSLAIRGTYDTIQSFLRELANNKELMEVLSIRMENEAGVDRSASTSAGNADVPTDPMRPIKLTARLRLVIQPKMD